MLLLLVVVTTSAVVLVLRERNQSDPAAAAAAGAAGAGRPGRPQAAVPSPPPGPVLAAAGREAPLPSEAGLLAALAAPLADRALGGRVSLTVADAATGRTLLDRGGSRYVTPASTAKIATAVAALDAVGGQTRLVTRVVAGASPGQVVLVGGGDPTLAGPSAVPGYPRAARLADLAAPARRALGGPVRSVVVDATRWTGPLVEPTWSPSYLTSGNVAPITAVMIDGGRVRPDRRARSAEPDLAAGRALAALLGAPGAAVTRGSAPAGARELARVESPPVSALAESMLLDSNNVLAEALARHVATARGLPADFAGAARAVREVVGELGADPAGLRLVDGSGLSRSNALQPSALVKLLAATAAPERRRLHGVFAGLPVAGYLGTLSERYTARPASAGAGMVRAKTGTLRGVSTLAGTVRTVDGRLLVFAVAADRLADDGTLAAEGALDRVAATLSRCGCR